MTVPVNSIQPVRIQLSRRRGFRLHEASMRMNGLPAVNCARPSRWGNPYPVAVYGLDLAMELFRNSVNGTWNPVDTTYPSLIACAQAYDLHVAFVRRHGRHPAEAVRDLRGKNLGCWCKPTDRCHCDILLEMANR